MKPNNNVSRIRQELKQESLEILGWLERHPRLGWYIATVATLNLILELASLLYN